MKRFYATMNQNMLIPQCTLNITNPLFWVGSPLKDMYTRNYDATLFEEEGGFCKYNQVKDLERRLSWIIQVALSLMTFVLVWRGKDTETEKKGM
jgi:hypothetical protein